MGALEDIMMVLMICHFIHDYLKMVGNIVLMFFPLHTCLFLSFF